jgi:DNA modification methylase
VNWTKRVYVKSCEAMPEIPDASVQCCVTSPPYYCLRDYGIEGQIGLEPTIEEYVQRFIGVFREVRRVLRDDGLLWLNLGDSYAGSRWGAQGREGAMADRSVVSARQIASHPHLVSNTGTIRDAGLKPKDLMGIPWRVAFALQADGWWLRDAIVWHKPNPMPSSVSDRCTPSYEFVFMLAKKFITNVEIREPGAPLFAITK